MTVERKTIAFSKWTPVARDNRIGYEYVVGVGPRGARKISPGGDRWQRAKWKIARAAIALGIEEFRVYGGVGSRRWVRTVTVTQDEADEFFRHAIEDLGDFMLRGEYRRASARRELRLEREVSR